MYPMKMIPAFKDFLWGGEQLLQEYGKETNIRPVAESWEISCHPDGPSLVGNGEFAGKSLADVIRQYPHLLGTSSGTTFPILIKLIDAVEGTSLQVHPDDEYARKAEGQPGKNEMWYVLDAKPNTVLWMGFNTEASREELKARIENNTILDIVLSVPIKPGDCFMIPAGMIHAIGKGALLAEIQQSSNITYRMYDYNRRDASGNFRKLHIDKALDVVDTNLRARNQIVSAQCRQCEGYRCTPLATWQWFQADLLEIRSHSSLQYYEAGFYCILVIDGKLFLQWESENTLLQKGESLFIPAGIRGIRLVGTGKVILTYPFNMHLNSEGSI